MSNQQRIYIPTRKIGPAEEEHRRKVKELQGKIKRQRAEIQLTEQRLGKARIRQHQTGRRTGEKPVTLEVIEERTAPMKKYLKRLEAKFVELTRQKSKIQRESSQQADIFNS